MSYSSIDKILAPFEAIESISDIHICANDIVWYRNIGKIIPVNNQPKVTVEEMDLLLKQLLYKYPQGYETYLKNRELDFSFYSVNNVPYRINAYFKAGNMAVALRKIAHSPFTIEQLMYEDLAKNLKTQVLNKKSGLFLVTGPSGSGKTTTLIAILQYLNEQRQEHIITIEDPIEFIFTPQKCLFSQRELGADTYSYEKAMKSVVREDPNIIFVGEIRDRETAETTMNLAETGRLVFSTLHTRSASSTIHRFVSFFPSDMQESIKERLVTGLLGVQSQILLPTKDEKSMIGVFELMLTTVAIKNDIRKNDGKQIDGIIETSMQYGMISHKEYIKRLIIDGKIDKSQVDGLF